MLLCRKQYMYTFEQYLLMFFAHTHTLVLMSIAASVHIIPRTVISCTNNT